MNNFLKDAEVVDTSLPLIMILVEDPKIGGFTAYFKQFPEILAEGGNEKEASENLLNAVAISPMHSLRIKEFILFAPYDVFIYDVSYIRRLILKDITMEQKPNQLGRINNGNRTR